MKNLQKPKRIVDESVLENARRQPCRCCNRKGVDPHHVTSVGAMGDDTYDNVIPLCREHHVMWHKEGLGAMYRKFQGVRDWLWIMQRHDVVEKLRRVNGFDKTKTI